MKQKFGLLCICICIILYVIFSASHTSKIYTDRTGALFEMRYPSTIMPRSIHSGDFYTVYFEEDIVVASAPKIHTLPIDPTGVITDHIQIDGHKATVVKTRLPDGQLSDGYKILFQTNTRLYRLFILRPDRAGGYLESFKVLPEHDTIAR